MVSSNVFVYWAGIVIYNVYILHSTYPPAGRGAPAYQVESSVPSLLDTLDDSRRSLAFCDRVNRTSFVKSRHMMGGKTATTMAHTTSLYLLNGSVSSITLFVRRDGTRRGVVVMKVMVKVVAKVAMG